MGTHHFASIKCAMRYYRNYGYKDADITSKLRRGEIAIGEPKQADGSRYPVVITDKDGRYHIKTTKGETP